MSPIAFAPNPNSSPDHGPPLRIGSTFINSRVMLAPMAGVTDVVFRSLVRQWAPESLICTEMISSNGLVFSKRWDSPILDKTQTDHPIAYQLAANREDILLEAATSIVKNHAPDTIDLNMGCPVKKITGNFEGCSLMREPERAHRLISALVQEIPTPVTVKFRLGWDANSMNYLEFGQMAQDAGAKMVVLHARTRAQGYKPGCKWEAFGELKEALKIPVIANGDIVTWQDVQTVIRDYHVDGVMVGRGAMGNPWLIGHLDTALKTGILPPEPPLEEKMNVAYEHARLLSEYKGELPAIREMRRHLPDYVKGFPGASQFRTKLTQVTTLIEVRSLLDEILTHSRQPALIQAVS